MISRQGEGHELIAGLFFRDFVVPSSRDDHVLFAVLHKRHGRGVTTIRKFPFPQFFAGFDGEGAEVWVEDAADEDQSSGCDNWAAESERSGRDGRLLLAEVLH